LKVIIIAKLIPVECEVKTAIEVNIRVSTRAIWMVTVIEAHKMPANVQEWIIAV
jgi:hypothetical protein